VSDWQNDLGTAVSGAMTRFCVWAPETISAEVIVETLGRPPEAHAMLRGGDGFHRVSITGVGHGDLYRYRLDGTGPFPDPASRFQPQGVHGPSQVVDWSRYVWSDAGWRGIALEDTVFYELHIGTFTPEGTFAAAAERLSDLRELGITAIELMPVGDFPGRWNWGYDGVAPFAPARCYGTPDDLRGLVDQAHGLGLAVHLDVVYNHLGPDGAYQSAFSRFYYSKNHHSPWGAGINFDGPQSEAVRDYVIKNALRWIHEYHFDGLRLDATHAIVDDSVPHILAAIASAVQCSLESSKRRVHVIAEDVRNLAGMMQPESQGGWALSGVWSDDFHHQMRRALAGDSDGYFQDFDGTAKSIAATARQGWFYTGQYAPYFGKPRGTDPAGIAARRFIFFLQNHDQAGNRAFGDRIHHKIELAQWRAASALLLMLPETPLLFMGQEWAATTPFLYFTDHNPELGGLVTEGRRKEFSRFATFADPASRERIPDPQREQTFRSSQLRWGERTREPHASVARLYQRLLALRKTLMPSKETFEIAELSESSVVLRRAAIDGATLLAFFRFRGFGLDTFRSTGIWKEALADGDVVLTTEDPWFANDPQPIRIDARARSIEFIRAGAVILRLPSRGKKEPG
jgi:maltooligosyltrehalose trehalohydrolase